MKAYDGYTIQNFIFKFNRFMNEVAFIGTPSIHSIHNTMSIIEWLFQVDLNDDGC